MIHSLFEKGAVSTLEMVAGPCVLVTDLDQWGSWYLVLMTDLDPWVSWYLVLMMDLDPWGNWYWVRCCQC